MLPRKNKLKKKNDFDRAFEGGKYYYGSFVGLKIIENGLDYNRFGIIVGSKISKKSAARNKIKRRIEESIRLNSNRLKTGFDILVLTKPEILSKAYYEIEETLMSLFQKAGLKTD